MTTTLFLCYNIFIEKGDIMSKKVKPIVIDAMSIWHMNKPKYNPYQTGHGVHGKNKYSRKEKYKADWRNYDYN